MTAANATTQQGGKKTGGKKPAAKSSNVVANLEITPRSENYSQWYQDVIYSSEFCGYTPQVETSARQSGRIATRP